MQVVIASYKFGYRSTPPKVERMPYIKLTKEDNARRSFISAAQRDAIFAAASQEGLAWRVLVEFAYLLGWRKGELLGLTVGNINVADQTICVDTSKNGEAREVPMTDRLAMLTQQLVSVGLLINAFSRPGWWAAILSVYGNVSKRMPDVPTRCSMTGAEQVPERRELPAFQRE